MKNIVVISVEKIQKYIYKYIDQNQNDEKTLKSIILASNNISEDILNKIQKEFNISKEDELLWISGKVIFKSDLPKEEIKKKLVKLYREVYIEYEGNIFLNYSVFPEENLSDMEVIKEANKYLKGNQNKVKIIEENKDLLFNFQEFRTKKKTANLKIEKECLQVFLNNMDDLVDTESESTDGKIAIVKADINNLGNTMQEIDSYSKFKATSETLKKYINLNCFARYVRKYTNKDINHKILPFYMAGDDIFYAVKINYLFDSIRILKNIIDQINSDIKKIFNEKESNTNISNKLNGISIAVGVTFVNNHQPIRYYRQIVEEELGSAKGMMKSDEKKLSLMGLSISGCKFNWYKKRSEDNKNKKGSNGKSDGFNRFCCEVGELNNMMVNNVFTSSSLHKLLINLENEKSPERQLLYILYFCKPNLLKNKEFNEEFYFKSYILSQIVEDPKGKDERFFDKDKIGNILIPKLKIILLFLRENKNNSKSNKKKYITSNNRARSILLNKPINFFLQKREKKTESDDIENLFIKIDIDKTQNKRFYKAAGFEPSIFFRAKGLIENKKKDQVITLFKSYFENVIDVKNKNSPHIINFDINKFEKRFKKTKDTVWLDKLILLFEYNNQRIIYKTYEKNKNE